MSLSGLADEEYTLFWQRIERVCDQIGNDLQYFAGAHLCCKFFRDVRNEVNLLAGYGFAMDPEGCFRQFSKLLIFPNRG
jgi:hypothetical protein